MVGVLNFLPRPLQRYVTGNVTKQLLLSVLLPLSFLSLFSTLVIAAQDFPGDYDWRKQVISRLISPRYNPEGFLLPSLGMAASALLCLPVAGYIGQRLRQVSPKLAKGVGRGLGAGIFLVVTVALPFNVEWMPKSLHGVHEALARAGAVGVVFGLVCCCFCGLADRFSRWGGGRTLHPAMVSVWILFTLVPVVCGVFAGILRLARKADLAWAHAIRMELKQSMIWQLAFWEWVGVVGFVLFMIISVGLLPARVKDSP
jgi:hypothetical protein